MKYPRSLTVQASLNISHQGDRRQSQCYVTAVTNGCFHLFRPVVTDMLGIQTRKDLILDNASSSAWAGANLNNATAVLTY